MRTDAARDKPASEKNEGVTRPMQTFPECNHIHGSLGLSDDSGPRPDGMTRSGSEGGPPDGDGAARTGKMPLCIWQTLATERPFKVHESLSLHCNVGTTSVKMGTGGRYLLTKPAVVPGKPHVIFIEVSNASLCLGCENKWHVHGSQTHTIHLRSEIATEILLHATNQACPSSHCWSSLQGCKALHDSAESMPSSATSLHASGAAREGLHGCLPVWVYTMMSLAPTLSAERTAEDARDSSLLR